MLKRLPPLMRPKVRTSGWRAVDLLGQEGLDVVQGQGADQDRVHAPVRGGAVGGLAGDGKGDAVGPGHHHVPGRSGSGRPPGWGTCRAMMAVHRRVRPGPRPPPCPGPRRGRPGEAFLGGLQDEAVAPGQPVPEPASSRAAPRARLRWKSWPQACITPSTRLRQGTCTVSPMGRASMSARKATTPPGRAPCRSATTPWPAMPCCT